MKKLIDKVAIITGGGSGLGKAILQKFVEEGASVLICGRHKEILEVAVEEMKPFLTEKQHVFFTEGDVSNERQSESITKFCIDKLSRIDILVNNAGVHGAKGELDEVMLSDWKKAIEVNLYGTLHMIYYTLPYMKHQNHGKIINISGGGSTSPRPYFSAYAASKTAVVRLTENLAVENKPYHIDINAIAPGAMNTRLLEDILASDEKTIGEEYQKALKQKANGGTSPEIPATLCVFLASSDSDGLSGKLISAVWDDLANLSDHRNKLQESDIFTLRRIIPQDRGENWDKK